MINWQPINTAPKDKAVLVCFYNEENRHKYVMIYGYATELSKRGKVDAVGWADINLPEITNGGGTK